LQRREWQLQNPFRWCRAHRHSSSAETAIEQQLDEQTAVGVTDQHGRLDELADDSLVVVDDLGDTEPPQLFGVLADFLDVAVLAPPLRRRDGEAALAEVLGVVLPAARRQPRTVDEHQRDLVTVAAAAHYSDLLRVDGALTPDGGYASVEVGFAKPSD